MNFPCFEFSAQMQKELTAMESSQRMPHAIIITGGDSEKRKNLCTQLSMWAVCNSEGEHPCGECAQCHKAKGGNHSDIYFAKGSGKTNIISVEEIRSINMDTAIIPNEALRKVYIFYDADKRMRVEALNAFLKTLEEPSQDILFLLTAESTTTLPETILSRCTVLSLEASEEITDKAKAQAAEILMGIININELPLLKATSVLTSRAVALEVLPVVRSLLSDALALSVGAQPLYDEDIAQKLRMKLTKNKIIGLIDATNDALNKTNRNVNLTLMSTWLCGEYRRISWQK